MKNWDSSAPPGFTLDTRAERLETDNLKPTSYLRKRLLAYPFKRNDHNTEIQPVTIFLATCPSDI